MTRAPPAIGNALLAALPSQARQRLTNQANRSRGETSRACYEANQKLRVNRRSSQPLMAVKRHLWNLMQNP